MKPVNILFEKLIQDGTIDNDKLIKMSEHRRSMFHNIYHDKDVYDSSKAYYNSFVEIANSMKANRTTLTAQPLFQWEGHGSNNWVYEHMNIEHLLSKACFKRANLQDDLKRKRAYYKEAIQYAQFALNTLQTCAWEDASIRYLPIFQDRYHLHHIFKCASYYYKTVNEYSKKEKNKTNDISIRLAYQFMDVACNVWKYDQKLCEELGCAKALYALSIANKLDDDKCGEKVALLKDFAELNVTPEVVKSEYKRLKQQNEQVYFGKEQTEVTITPCSLVNLFHSLPDISGDL
jgi:hypothetical protein